MPDNCWEMPLSSVTDCLCFFRRGRIRNDEESAAVVIFALPGVFGQGEGEAFGVNAKSDGAVARSGDTTKYAKRLPYSCSV